MSSEHTPTTDEVCAYSECGRLSKTRGFCRGHYQQSWKGQELRPLRSDADPMVAFWEKVAKTDGCWIWKAWKSSNGYGLIKLGGKARSAHRVSYEELVGPIPEGKELDHLCRTRECVNPDHLEPVDHRTNTLRGDTITAKAARTTHCPRGHALIEGNLVPSSLKRGKRQCLRCSRDKARERNRNATS